jgi:hypothetical protein
MIAAMIAAERLHPLAGTTPSIDVIATLDGQPSEQLTLRMAMKYLYRVDHRIYWSGKPRQIQVVLTSGH